MKPELQQIFDTSPEDEARSKLEPYGELILRWKRQGRSYRRILTLLRDQCNLTTAYGPLYRFVQRRSRPRKPELKIEPIQTTPAAATQAEFADKRTEGGSDPYAEARARMARDKAARVPPKPAKTFEYTDEDSINPIVMLKNEEEN